MGLEKVGTKFITAWAKTGEKSLLATRPVKVNIAELKFAPKLERDVFSSTTLNNYLPNEILSKINLNECISEIAEIGCGGEAAIYRIKGTDFLLRVHHNPLTNEKVKTLDLRNGIDFNVSARDKVNNIIGKFKGGEIVKYIKGQVVQSTKDKDVLRGINNISDNSIKEYLRKIFEAEKQGLYHDNFGANALFDKASGRFMPIDFWENKSDGILSSIMDQCTSQFINKEKLMKKTLRNLFEMIKKGEIDSSQLNLQYKRHWLQDSSFAQEIENICSKFNKDKSLNNIDFLLKKLNQLNEFKPEKIQCLTTKMNEMEEALGEVLSLPVTHPHREKQIQYIKDKINYLQSIIEWKKNEISYIR